MVYHSSTENVSRSDVDPHIRRRKIFLPAAPPGMPATAVGNDGTTTTTVFLKGIGDQSVNFADLNSTRQVFPRLTAQNDEVCLTWKVPDEFYNGSDMHVWVIFAPDGTTTTGATLGYDVKYSTRKVVDYARKTGNNDTLTGEAASEASTAMDTDLDEVIYMDGLTQYGFYRGARGTIKQGKVEAQDIMHFKIEADQAVTDTAAMSIIGLEIDYALRLRQSAGVTETYYES